MSIARKNAVRLARALGLPLAYMFAMTIAKRVLLLAFSALSKGRQDVFLADIERTVGK